MAGEGVETEEELAELLKNLNQTPESFRAKVRKDMLKQRLVQGMIGSKLVITDAQIEEEFAGSTEHSGGANYHLRVIMMPSAEELDDVLEQVDDGDLTFAEAATRYSVGPVPELGGDLGSIPANGMAEDWRAAVEAVEPGERTAVFDANGMATVLLVEGMGALKVDDVPGMRDKIFEKLRSEKMEVLFEEYMDRVRQMAVIEWK
jgi:peptidyl-prolyl cis-trans isomerase SurA